MKIRKSTRRAKPRAAEAKVSAKPGFEPNPFYESLLEIKETKPEAYRVLSPATRYAAEAYAKIKSSRAGAENSQTII